MSSRQLQIIRGRLKAGHLVLSQTMWVRLLPSEPRSVRRMVKSSPCQGEENGFDSHTDRMKIAFDIDGTYTTDPGFFNTLAKKLQSWGHRVGFLTLRDADDLPFFSGDIKWDFVYGATMGELTKLAKEGFVGEEAIVTKWKTRICIDHQIDIVFDDKAEFIQSPTTKAVIVTEDNI